jgi:hypothetical protein
MTETKTPAQGTQSRRWIDRSDVDRGPSAQQVAEAIRQRIRLTDRTFDRFLPYELRILSAQHWTPLSISLRVGEWLDQVGAKTVVDIGSGAGKFCVVAGLCSGCTFTGIEQRPRLVEAARDLARLFGIDDRVRFIQGRLGESSIPSADAYYLYNPFGENLFESGERMDEEVEFGIDRYSTDVALAEDLFSKARIGTHVIKYNGFGGRMPSTYSVVRVERVMNGLRMWRRGREKDDIATPPDAQDRES